MLEKTNITLIMLIKNKYNTKYTEEMQLERIVHFIKDTYRLNEVSNERVMLELKEAFLDVLENIEPKRSKSFIREFLRMMQEKDLYYAYSISLHLLQVKDANGYINGFYEISD